MKKLGIEQIMKYLYKDPEKNLPKLMDWADKFSKGEFESQRKAIRHAIEDPSDAYYPFIRHMINDVDHDVLTTIAVNFFINANLIGWDVQESYRQKYNCNIPWAILLDPTSACNLHCTGCWAAEYGNKLNLTFDEIDDIIRQGKEMGVYMYIYTGGEPLVRVHPLFRFQHSRKNTARSPAVAALHGVPRWPAVQREPPAPVPHAGKPGAAGDAGQPGSRLLSRIKWTRKRGSPCRRDNAYLS